jgi:site-specific recombinase XerD
MESSEELMKSERELKFEQMEAYATDLRKAEERVAKAELDLAKAMEEHNKSVLVKNEAQRQFDISSKAWRSTLVDCTPALALAERNRR